MSEPLLELRHLSRFFTRSSGVLGKTSVVKAVDDVTLSLPRKSTLGLVGESGSGKSTLARMAVRLLQPSAGNAYLDGQPLFDDKNSTQSSTGRNKFLSSLPERLQIIFQDPYSSLNPRLKIGYSIAEPLICLGISKDERNKRVAELLELVGISSADANRYPHEFSGGQRQRLAIARALAPKPEIIVCDEPVSSLDASVQAQVLNLLKDSQDQLGLSYLFISHDLTVVSHMSDTVAVMYMGRIVETGPADEIFSSPLHPYTRLLLDASQARKGAGREQIYSGQEPPEQGCSFAPRCNRAQARCLVDAPALKSSAGRAASCFNMLP